MDRRYPPLDPRSHSPGSEAASAMEMADQARLAQPRLAGPGAAGNSPSAPLTPEQVASLMDDRRDALSEVLTTRMEIANLFKERQPGNLLSMPARATEDRAKAYFDSASDGTMQTVDAHLKGLEGYLRDPGTAKGGRYDYRSFTPAELAKQKGYFESHGKGFAAAYTDGNAVGINYPVYSQDPKSNRLETQVHEWLHALGLSVGKGEELYDHKASLGARAPGGTDWAVNKNAENTALFAVRRRQPDFVPLPPWP